MKGRGTGEGMYEITDGKTLMLWNNTTEAQYKQLQNEQNHPVFVAYDFLIHIFKIFVVQNAARDVAPSLELLLKLP